MYMDDGLIFGESEIEMEAKIIILKENMSRIGVEIAENKSRWVKRDGIWQGSVKFLD